MSRAVCWPQSHDRHMAWLCAVHNDARRDYRNRVHFDFGHMAALVVDFVVVAVGVSIAAAAAYSVGSRLACVADQIEFY